MTRTIVDTENPIGRPATEAEEAEFDAREAEWSAQAATRALAECVSNRADAYRTEADPLFFQVQRGDIAQDVWLAKVAEIKIRFPKPE